MLAREDLEKIVLLECNKLLSRLEKKGISLKLSQPVISMLVDKGFNPEYGARPMRRSIESSLEDPIAEAILRGELVDGVKAQAILDKKDKKTISFKLRKVTALPVAEPATEPKPRRGRPKKTAS